MRAIFVLALLLCFGVCLSAQAETRRVTVIYDDKPTTVNAEMSAANDLWVTMADLKRATRFVVKPQGICRDELCFPIPKSRKAQFVKAQKRVNWFNLSEFARLVKQPVAQDDKHAVYYFGARADERNGHINSLEAPDFTLSDLNGKQHSLADFRGKKVLLVTWASW